MTRTYKPLAIHAVWNIDLSVTLFSAGKKLIRFNYNNSFSDPRGSAEAYISGWFGENPRNVRWSFPTSKKVAA